MEKLTKDQINDRLRQVPDWRIEQGNLCKDFVFGNFSEAFGFITAVAREAERIDHHPDWSNSYNKVSIRLFTHSVNGITDNDFALARAAEKAARKSR